VGPTNKSKEKRRSHRKVTRLVLTVVTVYVLCWLPYWISQVSLIFTPPKASQSPYIVAIFLLAGCLGYSNSAVNPILYAFLSDNFKKSFMKVFLFCRAADYFLIYFLVIFGVGFIQVPLFIVGCTGVHVRRTNGGQQGLDGREQRVHTSWTQF
jgi:hypothetical protein